MLTLNDIYIIADFKVLKQALKAFYVSIVEKYIDPKTL